MRSKRSAGRWRASRRSPPNRPKVVLNEFHHITTAGRLCGARRHRIRPQAADARLRAGHRQTPARPPHQGSGRGCGIVRRHPEGRSAVTGQVHPQRASADHRAGALPLELIGGGRIVDVAAAGHAVRCGAAHGQSGSDFARSDHEDRRRDRPEAERVGRVQPRIVRRRARRGRNDEPAGFRRPAARFSTTSKLRIRIWRRPSGT